MKFLKPYIPFILIAVLTVVLFFSLKGCAKREIREHFIIQAAEQAPDTGRVWHDRYDKEHRRAEVAESDRKTMQLAYAGIMDSVAKLNGIKVKQIQQITWLTTELAGQHTAAVTNTRSASGTSVDFQYKDRWVSIYGTGAIFQDSLSDIALVYQVSDSLLITTMRRRTGWFRKGTFVDVTSANPEVHVLGLHSIAVRDKPKRWGIGLQVGARWDGQWRPYVGAGLSFNLIRF